MLQSYRLESIALMSVIDHLAKLDSTFATYLLPDNAAEDG
jgi:hypothetical protein